MYRNPQTRRDAETLSLRQAGGRWLKELREAAGLSQRELAAEIGAEYYTFVSQLETGRARVPPDQYRGLARALGVEPSDFVRELLRFYDPVTHLLLFGSDVGEVRSFDPGGRRPPPPH